MTCSDFTSRQDLRSLSMVYQRYYLNVFIWNVFKQCKLTTWNLLQEIKKYMTTLWECCRSTYIHYVKSTTRNHSWITMYQRLYDNVWECFHKNVKPLRQIYDRNTFMNYVVPTSLCQSFGNVVVQRKITTCHLRPETIPNYVIPMSLWQRYENVVINVNSLREIHDKKTFPNYVATTSLW